MKYLIAGLGNIGEEYANTRHNIGFVVADALALEGQATFKTERLAMVTRVKFKGRTLVVIKPTTYMNILSGLDNLTDDQLVSVENIIHDYILPKRAKGKDNGPQAGKEGTKKEGSTEGKTVRS